MKPRSALGISTILPAVLLVALASSLTPSASAAVRNLPALGRGSSVGAENAIPNTRCISTISRPSGCGPTPPAISSVSPTSGPASGGTLVTITGGRFVGVSAVDFGSVPSSMVIVDSLSEISAIAPPQSAGTVNITVVATYGTSAAVPADEFTFTAANGVRR
jgi:hypothetical protein